MTIYSWNMLFENQELEQALDFIKKTEFDVFCLQEVPQKILPFIQELPYYLVHIEESLITTPSRTFPIYSVIISKYEIINSGTILFPSPPITLRSRVTSSLLNLFRKEESVITCRNRKGLFIDIMIHEKTVRIFNLHLALSYPKQRMKELTLSMAHKNGISIVCGDFNILEKFYISILNWLLGGPLSDWIFYKRERAALEKYFESIGLTNTLKNKITHPLSSSQLDHILVPTTIQVIKKSVLPNSCGSDHHPIQVQIGL